ncbi:DNA adenine methylase [Dubosiella newyorkensis]|uniref:DNA adenine methylase n=1 Tax=Dubosiella newyorkensis TaxID=1862672 RepID=UPI0023F4A797|nr:DNA adenine methylase [Dubosiella newyorkensis]
MNNSPLRYPGGKHKMFRFVQQLIKENNCITYIEAFCGGAAIALELLRTKTVQKIIINDFDYSIYLLWKMILERPEELIDRMVKTEVTYKEWEHQKTIRKNPEKYSELEIAFSTLFLNRTNRSGIIDKAGPIGGKKQDGTYRIDCRFNKEKLAEKIRLIYSMKDNINLYNLDARDFLEKVIAKEKNAFTFFDPPYFHKGQELYSDFLGPEDHQQLATRIVDLLSNEKWIVTYDNAQEIKSYYSPVQGFEYSLQYTLQEKKKATELIFFSPKLKIEGASKFIQFKDKAPSTALPFGYMGR